MLHPEPSPHILLPIMDTNLAQISRCWIASVPLTSEPLLPPVHVPISISIPTSWIDTSHPYSLLEWTLNNDRLSSEVANLSLYQPPHPNSEGLLITLGDSPIEIKENILHQNINIPSSSPQQVILNPATQHLHLADVENEETTMESWTPLPPPPLQLHYLFPPASSPFNPTKDKLPKILFILSPTPWRSCHLLLLNLPKLRIYWPCPVPPKH